MTVSRETVESLGEQGLEFYDGDYDGVEFHVQRTQEDDPADVSFSAEALASLQGQIMTLITARLLRRWEDTGTPPKEMKVSVEINWE